MEMAQDLRRWERYRIKVRAKITLNLNGATSSFFGEASDVSQGGLSLFLPRELEPGVAILMELTFPYNSRRMAIRGLIRNRHGFTYGVEFISPSSYQLQTIAGVCKALQLLS